MQNLFLGLRLLLTAATLAVVSGNYKIDVEFECTSTNSAGQCMKWTQQGKIESDAVACFPASALVETPSGHKRLDALTIGDEVLAMTHDHRVAFSPVRAWLHRDPTSEVTFLALKTGNATLRVTPTHNVYVDSAHGGAYMPAEQVKVGDALRMPNGVATVESVLQMVEKGAYAPLTYASTLFVGDDTDALPLLAHSYAGVRGPSYWQVKLFDTLLSAAEMTLSDVHAVEDPAAPYLHPVARLLAPLVGVSVDAKIVKDFFEREESAGRRLQSSYNSDNDESDQMIRTIVLASASAFLLQS